MMFIPPLTQRYLYSIGIRVEVDVKTRQKLRKLAQRYAIEFPERSGEFVVKMAWMDIVRENL